MIIHTKTSRAKIVVVVEDDILTIVTSYPVKKGRKG